MRHTALLLLWMLPSYAIGLETGNSFSKLAWESIGDIYHSITVHPFNEELQNGTLPASKFRHYVEQDSLYLKDFTKALILLASKMNDQELMRDTLKLALESLSEGNQFIAGPPAIAEPTKSPATSLYSNFLLSVAAFGSKEELAAALLPCYWIYLELAQSMVPSMRESNPYRKWVETYSSEEYQNSVQTMIRLTDRLADMANEQLRQKMLSTFVKSARMEWIFWEGAYRLDRWQPSQLHQVI